MNRPVGITRAIAVGMALYAAPALAVSGQSVSLTAGVRSVYDDNFLQYSGNQLADFDAGLHPLRFSVESTGDALVQPSLALAWELDRGNGRRHLLRLRGDGDFHGRNPTANYHALSARWTEAFARGRRFSLGYYRANDFYVRQLRDEDVAAVGDLRYRRAQFDLQIASAGWRQALGSRASLSTSYQFERRSYTPGFRERDSGTHQAEAGLDWSRLPHHASVGVHGGYRVSNARGSDGDEVGGVLDDDDVSYHGIEGGLGGRMEFTRRGDLRLGGDLAYEIQTRSYDSSRPADAYHYGRNDLLNAVEPGLWLRYRPHWGMRAFYRLEHNHASLGTSAPPTSDSGSYRVNQLGLAIEWSGDLWRQASEEEQE